MNDEQDVLDTFDALYRLACEERDAEAVVGLFVPDADLAFLGSDKLERPSGPGELRGHDGRWRWHTHNGSEPNE